MYGRIKNVPAVQMCSLGLVTHPMIRIDRLPNNFSVQYVNIPPLQNILNYRKSKVKEVSS